MDAPRRIKIRNGYINEPMPYATGGGETLSYILATPEALATSPEVAKLVAEEREAERNALVALEKAASEVSRQGAVTGPQWTRLSIAILSARAAIRRASEETGT